MELKLAYDNQHEVLQLFTEYTNMLLQQGEAVRLCLESQDYQNEVLDLEEKYGLPHGRLYLAYVDENAVGCVALKKMDDVYCEMKRLYVKPGNRGKHIGRFLIEKIIEDAKLIGYKHMRLDTLPFLSSAIELYRRYGFYDIERYNDNPVSTALYMQLDLDE